MGLSITALWQDIVNIAKKDMCNFIPLFSMLNSMGIVWLVYENGFYPWWYRRNMYILIYIFHWFILLPHKRYDNEPEAFRKEVLKTVSASKEKIDEPVKSDDPHILR